MNARHIARWDLDKTYLRTEFDTFKDLLRTAIERPDEKRSHPGAPSLLRELGRAGVEVHILSGSPEQMRSRLEDKLRLDGITWASFILKPNLQNMLRLRFRALRDQLGYKLPALLTSRAQDPSTHGVRETLFGDDAEADAYVYSLYADILAGRVLVSTLVDVLARAHVQADDIARLLRLADAVPRGDSVRRIFIHLERVSASTSFDGFGRRVCAFFNYFQPALVLVDEGLLSVDAALRVGAELVTEHGFDADSLLASHADLVARGQLGPVLGERFREARGRLEARAFGAAAGDVDRILARLAQPGPQAPSSAVDDGQPPSVDYLALFERDRARAARGKARAKFRGFRP